MKVIVTGANGMVAKALAKHCEDIGDEVVAMPKEQLDIANRERVLECVRMVAPDAVINCAAYTDVDGCETNQKLCYDVNAKGVENLALASKAAGSGYLTISTDYVFEGGKKGFYTQDDRPNPQSVYGRAKLEGETLAKRANERSIIVRAGWIFGSGGTNFLSVMHQILASGNSVRAISDSWGTPTYADDLAKRIRQLIEVDKPLIFHVYNSGGLVSFYEFALKICDLLKYDRELVEKVSAGDLKRAAQRPEASGLKCLHSKNVGLSELQDWQDALREFLEKGKTQVPDNPNT